MVSFRAMISTFYLLKVSANGACIKISKFGNFTSWCKSSMPSTRLPEVIWCLLQLPWTLVSVLQSLLWLESGWNDLLKSSWKVKIWKWWTMVMELQWWNKCLDSLYMMYRRCLKWKFRECTSGLKDRCLRLETLLQWWFWENLWSFESARGFEGLPMQKLRGFQLATDLSICREDLRGWEILFYKLWNFGLVEMIEWLHKFNKGMDEF